MTRSAHYSLSSIVSLGRFLALLIVLGLTFSLLPIQPALAADGQLVVRRGAADGPAELLADATLSGQVWISYEGPDAERVVFYLDGQRIRTERKYPFELGAGAATETTSLADGVHTVIARVITDAGTTTHTADFKVDNTEDADGGLAVRTSATGATRPLRGATLSGDVWISYDTSGSKPSQVVFYLDGKRVRVERQHPFDLEAGNSTDTRALPDGTHAVTALVSTGSVQTRLEAQFTVSNVDRTPMPNGADTEEKTPGLALSDDLRLMDSARGTAGEPLHGQVLDGGFFAQYATSNGDIARVEWYFNDPEASGSMWRKDTWGPPFTLTWDKPYDTARLGDGSHILTAVVVSRSGARKLAHAQFSVGAPTPETSPSTDPLDTTIEETTAQEPAGSSIGLHVSAAELREWRSRSASGPYRRTGDVSRNSPGDWDRIEQYAGAFMRNPAAGHWRGPSKNNPGGCVLRGSRGTDWGYEPPVREASQLRDAAFYALVKNSDRHADTVKSRLLAQAKERGVDFSNTSRWCKGKILDGNPGFMISTWLTKHLFAMDYLEAHDPKAFSESERALLHAWFSRAAELMRHDGRLEAR